MSTITDENTVFGFVTTRQWLGQYSASDGTQDFNSGFFSATATYNQTASLVAFNPSVGTALTHGFNTYFKMQGFNIATGQYEVWFSTGKPLLIPPSGHPLSNIQVVLTWTDR